MNQTLPVNPEADAETRRLREANAEARAQLSGVIEALRAILQDECLMGETPIEIRVPLESAVQAIGAALRQLDTSGQAKGPPTPRASEGPTQKQGQFLAFIREYGLRNYAGVAPSHADLQRFFNLTAPSVNSMLIRLEQRGFIRRVPGQARAIELLISPEEIPPLDRPFKF